MAMKGVAGRNDSTFGDGLAAATRSIISDGRRAILIKSPIARRRLCGRRCCYCSATKYRKDFPDGESADGGYAPLLL